MEREQRGFIDGFWLKLIMAVLMVLDHLYYNLFPDALLWAHYVSRVVAPLFAFLVAEGLVYTRNRRKYIGRMLGFALAMQLGSYILTRIFFFPLENSILMTLGLSAAMVSCLDAIKGSEKAPLWILAALGLFCLTFFFEGGYMIPLMIVIFYYLRRRPVWMCAVYVLAFGMIYLRAYMDYGQLPAQFFMVFAVVPILCYNGKRGIRNGFSKYFFYVFYPVHIWIIYLIERMVL